MPNAENKLISDLWETKKCFSGLNFLFFLTTLGAESLTWNFISLPEWLESRSYICLIVCLIVFYWFLKKKIFFWIFFCHHLVIYFVDFYWLSNFDETHVQEYLMVYYINNKNVRSKFVMVNFRDKIETKLQSEPLHFPTNLYFLSRTFWFWPKNIWWKDAKWNCSLFSKKSSFNALLHFER